MVFVEKRIIIPGKYWHPKFPDGVEIIASKYPYMVTIRVIGSSVRSTYL